MSAFFHHWQVILCRRWHRDAWSPADDVKIRKRHFKSLVSAGTHKGKR